MNSWKVILATIVIFGAGVITGGLLVDHVAHPAHPFAVFYRPIIKQTPTPYENLPPQMRPELLNTNFVQRLTDKLNLTPKQAERIRNIIAQSQQNTHDLWKLVAPQFHLIWNDTREQIKEVLTPEQQKQFEMLMHQQRQFRRSLETNAPPSRPPLPTNGPV